MRFRTLSIVLTLVAALAAAEELRAAGEPDPNFGSLGQVTTEITGNTDGAHAVALQNDGKIVVAGWAQLLDNEVSKDFAVVRYLSNGSPDPSFSGDGIVTTNFFGFFDDAYAVVIQTDGKVIAGGRADNANANLDFALVRYSSTGVPDPTFGPNADGTVETNFFGANDFLFDLDLQGDGKIVATGSAVAAVTNEDFALARYLGTGDLDDDFGTGGRVLTNVGGGNFNDGARAAVIQPDGKIVAVGWAASSTDTERALVRYNINGSLDPSFGTGGIVVTDVSGGFDIAEGVALQHDGKIVVVGETSLPGGEGDLVAARYLPNGTLDATFGVGGNIVTDVEDFDRLLDVTIQVDGKALATGIARQGTSGQVFVVIRYRVDGTLDPAFGNGGIVLTNFVQGNFDWGQEVVTQPDYKIVVAGETFNSASGEGQVAVARYTTDFLFVDGFESGDISAWSGVAP